MPVLVGKNKQIPMRLCIRKLPSKQAAKRIKAARKDRHSNTNHSEEYYKLLAYEIYLTNIDKAVLNVKQIAKLYGLRWYIEILFKSWKSYANFKNMFRKAKINLHRTLFTVYALLVEFVYLTTYVYHFVKQKIKEKTKRHLSILKFMDVANDLMKSILAMRRLDDLVIMIPQFAKHAVHEKYPKRKSTSEKYLYVNELCIKKK